MSRSRWMVATACFLACAACPSHASDLPSEKERWIEVSTANFTFVGNARDGAVRRVASDLEQLRSVLGQLFTNPLDAPLPTTIYVFKNEASFRPYQLHYRGQPANVAGYFVSDRDGNYVALDGDRAQGSDGPSSILYHEYLHFVLRLSKVDLPLWLNEGLAELYSTFEVDGAKAAIGRPIGPHLDWLNRRAPIPLPQLMAIHRRSPEYNEGSRRGVFYAQSWALVHYLYVGSPERKGQVATYVKLLDAGKTIDAAFAQAFGDVATLDSELRGYLKRRSYPYVEVAVSDLPAVAIQVRRLPWHEVLCRLGDLLAHAVPDQAALAEQHFTTALATHPDPAPALLGLGFLAERSGDVDRALARYREAVALAPDDPTANYRYGTLEQDSAESAAGPGGVAPESPARAKLDAALAALGRVVAVRPSFAEAWIRLGRGYTLAGESSTSSAIEAYERAFGLLPTRGDLALHLAQAHRRSGSKIRARQILRHLARWRDDPDLAAHARIALVGLELESALELYEEARYQEASTQLAEAREYVTDDTYRRRIDTALEEICIAARNEDFARRCNEAVRLAREHDRAGAVAVMRGLAAGAETEEHQRAAEAFLKEIKDRR